MNRLPDWQLRLDALVTERLKVPFTWGNNDCALFAADAVLAMTGHDLASDMRDHRSARQALETIRRHGGLPAIVTSALGPSCAAGAARQGDVVALMEGKHVGLAICIDSEMAVGPSRRGLVMLPMAKALCSWRVG